MENELLYIQDQMDRTKQMACKPKGRGRRGRSSSLAGTPPAGRGHGKGGTPPSAILGKENFGKKHGGLSGVLGKIIIMATVAAARAAGDRNQSYSSQLPDLGGSDPWSSGGEDDVGTSRKRKNVSEEDGNGGKTRKIDEGSGKGPRLKLVTKAPRKQINPSCIKKALKYRLRMVAL